GRAGSGGVSIPHAHPRVSGNRRWDRHDGQLSVREPIRSRWAPGGCFVPRTIYACVLGEPRSGIEGHCGIRRRSKRVSLGGRRKIRLTDNAAPPYLRLIPSSTFNRFGGSAWPSLLAPQ